VLAWHETWNAIPEALVDHNIVYLLAEETEAIQTDNHLEGSSIKRYSAVAEAMSNLRYHPIEETGDATIRRY